MQNKTTPQIGRLLSIGAAALVTDRSDVKTQHKIVPLK